MTGHPPRSRVGLDPIVQPRDAYAAKQGKR